MCQSLRGAARRWRPLDALNRRRGAEQARCTADERRRTSCTCCRCAPWRQPATVRTQHHQWTQCAIMCSRDQTGSSAPHCAAYALLGPRTTSRQQGHGYGQRLAPVLCALVSRTGCAATVQLDLGTQGDDSRHWLFCTRKVRFGYPCAAASASGMARRRPLPPAKRTMPLRLRGCALRAPVAAEARLTRPNVCLACCWNHLAAVDPAHGMLHK